MAGAIARVDGFPSPWQSPIIMSLQGIGLCDRSKLPGRLLPVIFLIQTNMHARRKLRFLFVFVEDCFSKKRFRPKNGPPKITAGGQVTAMIFSDCSRYRR